MKVNEITQTGNFNQQYLALNKQQQITLKKKADKSFQDILQDELNKLNKGNKRV